MLTCHSQLSAGYPEETTMDLLLLPDAADNDRGSWVGHPFRLRTTTREGTEVVFGFSLTECAEILLLLAEDARIRTWLDRRRLSVVDSNTLN